MFEIAVVVMIFSLFGAFMIAFSLGLFRLYLVIRDQRPWKEALLIVAIPGGLGYYHYYRETTKHKQWYQRFVVVSFILVVIGSVYLAFLHIPEFAHWFFYAL